MRRSHFAMIAAAAAIGTIALPPPQTMAAPQPDAQDGEKLSRQRKRWLERQARKQTRKHRTTRR